MFLCPSQMRVLLNFLFQNYNSLGTESLAYIHRYYCSEAPQALSRFAACAVGRGGLFLCSLAV